MSHPELAIAGVYDHEQENARRAPDWGGDDLFARPRPAARPTAPAERRTVTITGRPQATAVVRRPPRTLDERIAHRPDRIAAWTIAMGFLMVLLAIVTSH